MRLICVFSDGLQFVEKCAMFIGTKNKIDSHVDMQHKINHSTINTVDLEKTSYAWTTRMTM